MSVYDHQKSGSLCGNTAHGPRKLIVRFLARSLNKFTFVEKFRVIQDIVPIGSYCFEKLLYLG